jgi:hypothetical protein
MGISGRRRDSPCGPTRRLFESSRLESPRSTPLGVAAVEGVMVSVWDEVDEVLDALEAASSCGNAWGEDEEGMKMVTKKGRSELWLGAREDKRRGLKIDARRKHLHTKRLTPLPTGTRRLEKTSRKTRLIWGQEQEQWPQHNRPQGEEGSGKD